MYGSCESLIRYVRNYKCNYMAKKVKRTIVLGLGVLFVVLGILGLVLPIIQGILFIAIGVLLLSFYSPRIREWLYTHTRRFPKLHKVVEQAERWVDGRVGRDE